MIPAALLSEIEAHVGPIEHAEPLGGGSIASAFRLDTSRGRYFFKHAGGTAGASFEAEAEGLSALASAAEGTGVRVPRVLHARNRHERPGLLLLEWIPVGRADPGYFRRFGEALARLHRKAAPGDAWGFPTDNFIGATPQENGWTSEWPTFFRERRLLPQIELARRKHRWEANWDRPAERLLQRLDSLLPPAPERSLLHGDLWSGNHLPGADGAPWLIDPATYVGHREADLAMTELFGGFSPSFYDAYQAAWPLEPGYPERREIYNLYHLLNHLNLFGGSYAPSVERILRRFGG